MDSPPLTTHFPLDTRHLNEELTNLQLSLQEDRDAHFSSNIEKIRVLDAKLTRLRLNDDTRQTALKEIMMKLQENVSTVRYEEERKREKGRKDVKLVGSYVGIDVNVERQMWKETEGRVEKETEEKMREVKLEVTAERQIRENSRSSSLEFLADHLSGLQKAVETQTTSRKAAYNRLTALWTSQVSAFYQSLAVEEKAWKHSEASLLSSLEIMRNAVQSELQREQSTRAGAENQLIALLEATCSRVEQGLTFSLLS